MISGNKWSGTVILIVSVCTFIALLALVNMGLASGRTITVAVDNEDDDGGEGVIPGFEVVNMIWGIGVIIFLTSKKEKMED